MKLAKKELTRMGCELMIEHQRMLKFRLLTGATWVCDYYVTPATVKGVVERQRKHARTGVDGHKNWLALPEAGTYPVMSAMTAVQTCPHFEERYRLMLGQGMKKQDVEDALARPVTVRRHPTSRNLYYCGETVAIVVTEITDSIVRCVTPLWATEELWEENPRPEAARDR
ncbi:MAG: hypothetical protein ACK5LO_02470 [Leucobacter sp.]